MIWGFFDVCYLINLDKRPDRLALATDECKRAGVEFIRIPGTICNKEDYTDQQLDEALEEVAALGLGLSCRKAIELANAAGVSNCLMLEDDVVFALDLASHIPKVVEDLRRLPWDTVQFWFWSHGGGCEPVSPNLNRIGGTHQTHCWAINGCFFDRFLKEYNPPKTRPIHIDEWLRVSVMDNKLCTSKNLAFQRPGYSDIQLRNSSISAPPK